MSFITLTIDDDERVVLEADAVESIRQRPGSSEWPTMIRTASGDTIRVTEEFDTVVQLVGEHRSWELVDVVPVDDPIGNAGEVVVRRPR